MQPVLLSLAAALIVATMAIHSLLGHSRLIRPLLGADKGVLAHPLARFLIPFAWHLTTGISIIVAAVLLAWAWAPALAQTVGLTATTIIFTASGIYDAIGSRGKHIGWPLLTAVGLTAFAALLAS